MLNKHLAVALVVVVVGCKGEATSKTKAEPAAAAVQGEASTEHTDAQPPANSAVAGNGEQPSSSATLPYGAEREILIGPAASLLPTITKQDFAPVFDNKKLSKHAIAEAGALHKQAHALHQVGKLAEARDLYVQTLAKNPGHIRARYNLASAFVDLGEHDKALSLLAELERVPKCIDCWLADYASADSKWAPLWDSRLFQSVVTEVPSGRDEDFVDADADEDEDEDEDEDWLSSFCNPGETRSGEMDEYEEGTVYCLKGGRRHGSFYNRETGYDMSEGETNTRGNYKNGKKHGTWSHWESFGDDWRGEYRNDEKHGLWSVDSKTTTTYEVIVEGALEGTHWEITNGMEAPEGHVSGRTDYKLGKKYGPYMSWRVDETLRVLTVSGEYKDDKLHGIWVHYDEDTGNPTKLITYRDGVVNGPYKYWKGTELIAEGAVVDGNGSWVLYDYGKLLESGQYRNGEKHGPWIEETGQGSYANGLQVGKWIIGKNDERSEGSFEKGNRTGLWTYYEGGSTIAKGQFKDDSPDGEWTAQVDGQEADLLFRKGRLRKIDGERFDSKYYEYSEMEFAWSGTISVKIDDEDEYPY